MSLWNRFKRGVEHYRYLTPGQPVGVADGENLVYEANQIYMDIGQGGTSSIRGFGALPILLLTFVGGGGVLSFLPRAIEFYQSGISDLGGLIFDIALSLIGGIFGLFMGIAYFGVTFLAPTDALVRLARKRRHGRKGPLDFRNTVRHSLSYGGVPAEPKFKYPRPAKPELMVVADISGSVAAFARFTLMLVYAIQGQFSKVRSFVFIDGIDEVTSYFKATEDISEAIHRVNTEADVVWVDGHSDYGHAFEVFWERYGKDINAKTTILLLGDARNNYHATQSWVVKEMQKRGRHVYWLNPEPKSYWNTGDSVVGEYGSFTDGVYECRNLRQLESFVEKLA